MDFFSTLKDNLFWHYIIYVPEIAFTKMKGTIYEGMVPEEAANEFFYMLHLNKFSQDINDFTIANILRKAPLFESNIFKLFEAKKALDTDHFKVVLEKYYEQVNGHLIAVNWMLENINIIFKNIDQNMLNLFALQAEQFKNHYTELSKHFPFPEENAPSTNIVLTELKASYIPNPKEAKTSEPTHQTAPKIRPKKSSTRKPKLVIDDNEIDAFLLTSVFNVEL